MTVHTYGKLNNIYIKEYSRFAHKNSIKTKNQNVSQHHFNTGHTFKFDNTKILEITIKDS